MKREPAFEQLMAHLADHPIIDTHDHSQECGPKYHDPVELLTGGYAGHDLMSAADSGEYDLIADSQMSLGDRWPVIEKLWRRARNTGYSRVTRMILAEFHGITEVSLDALEAAGSSLPDYTDRELFESILEKARFEQRIANVWPDVKAVVDGSYQLTPRAHLTIGLPGFHDFSSRERVDALAAVVGASVSSLDDYLAVCHDIFESYIARGAIAFKDQSAYSRPIDFAAPDRAKAEEVFARMLIDPLTRIDHPVGTKPLGDYLFHCFLDMAEDFDLPVQLHTGHLAGNYGDIRHANAAQLIPTFHMHQGVRFDLFHANWPYGGEFLYLGKNFPNVRLNFCWANVIDPAYCRSLFRQSLSAVPRGKIHAHGSDYFGYPDRAWASAQIARENVAAALADAVAADETDLDEARETATMWFYDNPKEFFRLDGRELP